MGFVDGTLTNSFRKLGYTVAVHPKRFIVSSIIIALAMTSGLLQMKYDNDVRTLFANTNGRNVYEKEQILKYFHVNYTGEFSPSRMVEWGHTLRIIITVKDKGNLFRSKIWAEISELDDLIHSTKIFYRGSTFNYTNDLCAMPQENTCIENEILDLVRVMDRIENGSLRMSYPIMLNPETYAAHFFKFFISGLKLSQDKLSVISAEALTLNYILRSETEDDEKGKLWERAIVKSILAKADQWKYIEVYHSTYYSYVSEQEDNTLRTLPYLGVSMFFMCCFTIFTACSRDWVKAKPLVALCGIVVSTLGTLAAFGFLCYIGISCIGINTVIPFVMLGIGIDDTFVMLSTWRQTNPTDSVPKRLAETYAEAAVSITITSVTDMLSFYVGVITPIPSVQIFCVYAGTSIFCIYLFQIFCLGAVLGLSGHQEAKNRHAVFWWKESVPKSISHDKSTWFKLFFTGGINKSDPKNVMDNGDNAMMIFFRDYFSKFIGNRWVQCLVMIVWVGYFMVGAWGISFLEEGLKEERLYRDDSYLASYFRNEDKYFKAYQFRIQIAILTPLDYSAIETQERVADILEAVTNSSKYVSSEYSENWLTSFTTYVSRHYDIFEYNITTEAQFIDVLRNEFFQNNVYSQDVSFNEEGTKIIASRFIIQLVDTYTYDELKEAVVELRNVAAAQKDVEIVIFHPVLGFIDQFILIRSLTIQLLSIAAAIVMVVTFIFIPNIVTSSCVLLTTVSTELGVVGIMALWGVSLDMISLLCLVMCIGFSVDFSAHISHVYIASEGPPEARIQKALFSLGLPILQGGMSTIIGVSALMLIPAYPCQLFFKVIFLVITCAAWHGLFVLPVILLLVEPESLGSKLCGRYKKFKLDKA